MMASIRRELVLAQDAAAVWDALRDFHAVHTRVAPGFVTKLECDGDDRVLMFANGSLAREALVACDDEARRLVYAVIGGKVRTHSASVQVFELEPHVSRLVWIADLLPDELGPYIAAQMDIALPIMKRTLESAGASPGT